MNLDCFNCRIRWVRQKGRSKEGTERKKRVGTIPHVGVDALKKYEISIQLGRMIRPIGVVLILLSGCVLVAESPKARPSTREDFESGTLGQLGRQAAADDSITVVDKPVRSGRYAARTLLRAKDEKVAKGQRAEFVDHATLVEMDKDYWYGLSIFVPEEFVGPAKSNAVLFQWHTQQGGPSPVLAIRVRGDEWQVTTSATGKMRVLGKAPLKKGVWVDWVVHVCWASEPKGFWTVWKDGNELVKEDAVVTQYPEKLGPYAKFGQYHSVDETAQNVVYFDEYRAEGPDGSYKAVAPR